MKTGIKKTVVYGDDGMELLVFPEYQNTSKAHNIRFTLGINLATGAIVHVVNCDLKEFFYRYMSMDAPMVTSLPWHFETLWRETFEYERSLSGKAIIGILIAQRTELKFGEFIERLWAIKRAPRAEYPSRTYGLENSIAEIIRDLEEFTHLCTYGDLTPYVLKFAIMSTVRSLSLRIKLMGLAQEDNLAVALYSILNDAWNIINEVHGGEYLEDLIKKGVK